MIPLAAGGLQDLDSSDGALVASILHGREIMASDSCSVRTFRLPSAFRIHGIGWGRNMMIRTAIGPGSRSTMQASLAFAVVMLTPAKTVAQSVAAWVVDDLTGSAVVNALAVVLDDRGLEQARRTTDAAGSFTFPAEDGQVFRVWVSAPGYEPLLSTDISVRGSLSELEIRLQPQPIDLEPLAVSVEAQSIALERVGFFERRKLGVGRFITDDMIHEARIVRTSQALAMEPSVRFHPDVSGDGGIGTVVTFRNARRGLREGGGRPCLPTLVLDGVKVRDSGVLPLPTPGSGPSKPRPIRLDELVSPAMIGAIELYPSGAGAPVQWSGLDAGCGLIIVWTKVRHP